MNLIILAVSLALMVFMLAMKVWENRSERETFFTRFMSRGDDHIVMFYMRSRRLYRLSKERVVFWLLVEVPSHIERFFAKVKRRSLRRYTALSGKMRGERALGQGTASPFIRTLTKQK